MRIRNKSHITQFVMSDSDGEKQINFEFIETFILNHCTYSLVCIFDIDFVNSYSDCSCKILKKTNLQSFTNLLSALLRKA